MVRMRACVRKEGLIMQSRLTTWNRIIVAVDGSPESAQAAGIGWALAEAAGVPCHLIHAVPEAWQIPDEPVSYTLDADELNASALAVSRRAVLEALRGTVPQAAFRHLTIGLGRPAAVIARAARDLGAELVVIGGKHHSLLQRWLGGSTAHALVRTLDIPVLITRGPRVPFQRVLAAVDLSEAASPTVHHAERMAGLFDAELGLVHAVPPPPAGLAIPAALFQAEAEERSAAHLTRHVWPLTTYPDVRTNLRHGPAAEVVEREVRDWSADLLVVGSHGKGWFDRVVLGSVTERLINHLPASLLVVPVLGGVRSRALPQRRARPVWRAPATH